MDEYKLEKYLNIDQTIAYLKREREQTETAIYQQSLVTHIGYSEVGMYTVAPKIDSIVAENIEACQLIDGRLGRWKLRQRYFKDYLSERTEEQRQSLRDRTYSEGLKQKTLDEIQQIEIAIAFHGQYYSALEEPEEKNLMALNNAMAEVYAL